MRNHIEVQIEYMNTDADTTKADVTSKMLNTQHFGGGDIPWTSVH